MTTGADSSPLRTMSLKRSPATVALAGAEPADPRGKALELHALLREAEPAVQAVVIREQLEHRRVGARDVLGVTAQRDPAERSPALAELIADVRGHEPRVGERVGEATDSRLVAQRVAVVEHLRAATLILDHRLAVTRHRLARAAHVRVGVARAQRSPRPRG